MNNKLIAFLGVWVIALSFLGFSESLIRLFLILTGLLLVVLAIKKKPFVKSDEDFIKQLDQIDNVV